MLFKLYFINMNRNKKIERLKNKRKAREMVKSLLGICAVGALTLFVGGGAVSPKQAKRLWKELGEYSLGRVKQCLKRMKMQDYIRYDEDDLTKPIIITEKGLQRYALQTLKDKIRGLAMKRWDHIWRLVTFDVKEDERWRRDMLRRHLQGMNFFKLQKNVYIIPFAVEKELEQFIKTYKMYDEVLILQVADLGKKEKRAREYFLDRGNIK